MAVDRGLGIPFFHRIYRGNSQDANTFNLIVGDLVKAVQTSFKNVEELVLVLDKGNNKKETFDFLDGKIEWVGSLVPSQHEDLLKVPLEQYQTSCGKLKTLRRKKAVMGRESLLIMTYNEKLFRKQEHTLRKGIEKLKKSLRVKYDSYKKVPSSETAGLKTLRQKSRYKNFVKVTVDESGLSMEIDETQITERKKRLGKNLIFTSKTEAETAWVISQYKEKEVIEDAFKTMKDPELIRIRPLRHWTDTKIRAYIFCCVMIEDGFDFLGFNVRKYKGKLLIKPSKKSTKAFLDNIRELIKANKTAKTENLIRQLNPKIRGWANNYRHVVSKKIFSDVDKCIFQTLQQWIKRRHSNKNATWQRKKYFRSQGFRNWIFFARSHDRKGNVILLDLFKAAEVPIKRHVKIKGEANPYDPVFKDYFERRKSRRTKQPTGYGRFAKGFF